MGFDLSDDAGVFSLGDGRALVQTVDIFTPVVDSPHHWGRIAAANALSDIYAMGATPMTALQYLAWPRDDLPLEVASEVITGGMDVMDEAGCTVYENRPVTCRYYPLGLASIKMKGAEEKENFNFLVKESHCKGHDEDKLQSVAQFRREQGTEEYDRLNSGWMDILMKAASWASTGGPYGKEIAPRTQGMFYMVSTDVDAFRRFVFETRFLQTYEVEEKAIEVLKTNDAVLLALGFDWLKNVIFGETTISIKETVLQAAIAARREEFGAG